MLDLKKLDEEREKASEDKADLFEFYHKNWDALVGEIEGVRRMALSKVKRIQTGSGLDRSQYPEAMKGEIARANWDDTMFGYGMEYGYILALWVEHNMTTEEF